MTSPITRFKKWREYKQALRDMNILIQRQKEIPRDEDGSLSGDNKKLFDAYALSYALSVITVMDYRMDHLK